MNWREKKATEAWHTAWLTKWMFGDYVGIGEMQKDYIENEGYVADIDLGKYWGVEKSMSKKVS